MCNYFRAGAADSDGTGGEMKRCEMVRCVDCVRLEKCSKSNVKPQVVEKIPGCENGQRKPITNGDKIRGMSDKELSYFLDSVQTDGWNAESFDSLEFPEDVEEWCEWLKQEVTT